MKTSLGCLAVAFGIAAYFFAALGQAASDAVRSFEKQIIPGASVTSPAAGIGANYAQGQAGTLEKQIVPGSSATVLGMTGSPATTTRNLKGGVVPGSSGLGLGGAVAKAMGN